MSINLMALAPGVQQVNKTIRSPNGMSYTRCAKGIHAKKKLRSSNFATKVPLFVSSWEVNQEKSNLDLTHLIDFPDCWTSILSDHSINEIIHCFISKLFWAC